MEGFIEATLIIEGALQETKILDSDGTELDTWVSELRTEHSTVHAQTQWEVYTIHHSHPNDTECECVQYLQDHHPTFTIG
jgi:hypothetical protein